MTRRARELGIVLLTLGAVLSRPALATYAGWTDATLTLETARWEIGPEHVRQFAPSLAGSFVWKPSTDARLALRGSGGSGDGWRRLAPGASAAVLIRHQPWPDWRFHLGVATPSGLEACDPASLALARRAAEPLLALPDSDPVRGWRLHLSTLWGHTPERGMGLLLGAALDVATAFRATPEVRLDPSDAFSAQAALAWSGSRWRARARLHAARESEQRAAGLVVRGGRTLLGLRLEGTWEATAVRLGGGLGFTRSGVCRSLNPEVYGYWLHPGPGSLGELGLTAEPRGSIPIRHGIALRPAIEITWRRVIPEGLPLADGWAATTGARCSIGDDRRTVEIKLSRERGRWRAGDPGADPSVEKLRGWRFGLALHWRPAAPEAAEGASE